MDWNYVITINKDALTRIIAAIMSLLVLEDGSMKSHVARPVYGLVSRVLRKTESAVRRLIVVAAQGMVVEPSSFRPMPQGIMRATQGKRTGRARKSFQLFDPRPSFLDIDEAEANAVALIAASGPRIRIIGERSPHEVIAAHFNAAPIPKNVEIDATHLGNRLMLVKAALENLPHQARRLLRWKAKRANMREPKFISPLRPGPPPGRNKRGKDEIDLVLKECHALAWETLRTDTS